MSMTGKRIIREPARHRDPFRPMSDGRITLDKSELERSMNSLNEYTLSPEQLQKCILNMGRHG